MEQQNIEVQEVPAPEIKTSMWKGILSICIGLVILLALIGLILVPSPEYGDPEWQTLVWAAGIFPVALNTVTFIILLLGGFLGFKQRNKIGWLGILLNVAAMITLIGILIRAGCFPGVPCF